MKKTITGRELLRIIKERGPVFTEAALDAIEEAVRSDPPPVDKWSRSD